MSAEILIIDDNPDIRNIIRDLISESGYKTRVAANYNQALKEIDKKLPDVAIIDVKLDKGDNDGIELLSHIKKKNKDIPVIIISGHANKEMAIKSLKNGAFEFIEKPFDQDRLMNFVNRAVENFNLKNQNTWGYKMIKLNVGASPIWEKEGFKWNKFGKWDIIKT